MPSRVHFRPSPRSVSMPVPNTSKEDSSNETEPSNELRSAGVIRDNPGDRTAELAAVRADLARLVADVTRVVAARASQVGGAAAEGAEAGVDVARATIRSHPIPAVVLAAVAGAAIATLVVPSLRQTRSARLAERASGVTRTSFGDVAQGPQSSASSTGSSLLSAIERVANSVSTIDPKSSITPTLEKAAAWFGSLRGTTSGK